MADLDDSFDELAGFAKLPLVAKGFDFGSVLPPADFPPDFVAYYASLARGEPVDWDNDRIFFLARFDDHVEVCMYDGLFSPQRIQTQNAIMSQSSYADPGAIIMPPGYYAIGGAYNDLGEMRLMIDLRPSSPDCGKIYVWNLAWDALGTGDNTRGLGFVADTLQAFIEGLQPREAL
jgi:hypothetical protein